MCIDENHNESHCYLTSFFDIDDSNSWFLDDTCKDILPTHVIFDLDDTLIHEGFCEPKVCQDTKRVLDFFEKIGCKLIIASHNDNAQKLLEMINMVSYFDHVIGQNDTSKKPMLQEILKRYDSANPKRILFFDDLQCHVKDAKQTFGIRSHLVNWKTGIRMTDVSKMLLCIKEDVTL